MKTRNSNKQIETIQLSGGCCSTSVETKDTNNDTCCEQPTDGSSCCDKSVDKEINIEKTGCC